MFIVDAVVNQSTPIKSPRHSCTTAGSDEPSELSDEWTVQIVGGHEAKAAQVAEQHGLEVVRRVRNSDDLFIMKPKSVDKRMAEGTEDNVESCARIDQHEAVSWARRETVQKRTKRNSKVDQQNSDDGQLRLAREVFKKDGPRREDMPKVAHMFNDPLWPKQWYLHDTRTNNSLPKLDLRVLAAWARGINGSGVVVTILDDGLQANHSDIAANYKDFASYDLNDDDPDPTPRPDFENKHGTRCAGEVSMVANNSICGVGVAPASGIGGIRMLDGKVTDRLEFEALTHNLDRIDIFSASWGPLDNGKTTSGPGMLTAKAIKSGIVEGRNGLGTVYVWASGNGGRLGDDCNCDGYSSSPYTFSVNSASQDGMFPM